MFIFTVCISVSSILSICSFSSLWSCSLCYFLFTCTGRYILRVWARIWILFIIKKRTALNLLLWKFIYFWIASNSSFVISLSSFIICRSSSFNFDKFYSEIYSLVIYYYYSNIYSFNILSYYCRSWISFRFCKISSSNYF